jgi:hypothetical protein
MRRLLPRCASLAALAGAAEAALATDADPEHWRRL